MTRPTTRWLAALCLASSASCLALGPGAVPRAPWDPDRRDGTYRNPVLYADYSDPDVIRVGEDYYLTASSFHCAPGLPILRSRDLLHWKLVGHALPRLVPEDAFAVPQHGKGCWAPALRHHDGRFWIYYPDPDYGLYVVTAPDPAGPWSAPVLVKAGKGLIDPCPLWDDDGQVYLVHAWARSRAGFNNVLTLLRLSADGLRAEGEGQTIVDGATLPGYNTLEGPKVYKRDGYYWIFAPAGGVATGWQSVFRARDIRGPYEGRIVLRQGGTATNGPHQGAWVDTPSGQHWFLHFQDQGPYGRVVHLQPMTWRADGWPVMGDDADGDGTGEPVPGGRKPDVRDSREADLPSTSDEFDQGRLGLQWQWQANPREDWLSLTARTGSLRLFAQPSGEANLWPAPNLLLQKLPAPDLVATAALRFEPRGLGESAGLVVFGQDYAWIGVRREAAGARVVFASCLDAKSGTPETEVIGPPARGSVRLRVTIGAGARCVFSYSLDRGGFVPLGAPLAARPGMWVGAKVGLFARAASGAAARGYADFDWFRVSSARP